MTQTRGQLPALNDGMRKRPMPKPLPKPPSMRPPMPVPMKKRGK